MPADFVDSNVVLYLFDEVDAGKREVAETLIGQALETRAATISFQVVQETLNVITRKLPVPATPEDARRFLDQVLAPMWHIMPSQTLYRRALAMQARYRFGFYDALIVAAALQAGCTRLYSEDLQHGQQIEGLTIVNPFLK
jgi:predicted nucleic acid-binding protein